MMLGRQIGDPLWIEKEITSRTRLDRGKILILIPHDWANLCKVYVSMEEKSFLVQLEVDPMPLSYSWLVQFLGLTGYSSQPLVSPSSNSS